jgi:hypothetical protein
MLFRIALSLVLLLSIFSRDALAAEGKTWRKREQEKKAAAAAPVSKEVEGVLDEILGKARGDAGDIATALSLYNRIEAAGRFDIFARHRIHEELLRTLRERKEEALAEAAEKWFASMRSLAPSAIVLMKSLIGPNFPAPRQKRIGWLSGFSEDTNERLRIWSVHLLADSRWPEAVDALIDILEREEKEDPDGVLAFAAGSELYRLLGNAGRGPAARVRKNWMEMGRKLPESPDRSPPKGRATSSFFGDPISPRAVLAIDISSSMLQRATLRAGSARGVEGGETGGTAQKVDIVKGELSRALEGLRSSSRFAVIAYNADIFPWQSGTRTAEGSRKSAAAARLRLYAAGADSIRSARDWTAKLAVAQGTNIHDALAAALVIPDVETVYLLSDGEPSRGGGPAEIHRRVAALNYLAGVRIVTYGFAEEGGAGADETLMKELAARSWGWYRRLN